MQTIPEFLQQINFLRSKDYTCVYSTHHVLVKHDFYTLKNNHCALETDHYLNVIRANEAGIDKELIYYTVTAHSQSKLDKVFDKCQLIATSLDTLTIIDQQAGYLSDEKPFTSIALRMIPTEKVALTESNGIYLSQLADLSARLKKLNHIAIRGIFISPASETSFLATKLKENFSIIKNIRSVLPCTFSYFCMEGVTDELSNDTRDSFLDTLEVIRLLNNTSLYAEFLLS